MRLLSSPSVAILIDARLTQNLTQAALAERSGVAKRTIERLESGAVATQLSGFLRECRLLEKQFRRMVFNIVARNQDDHVNNIAFLMGKQGEWQARACL